MRTSSSSARGAGPRAPGGLGFGVQVRLVSWHGGFAVRTVARVTNIIEAMPVGGSPPEPGGRTPADAADFKNALRSSGRA
jgi:hypothetical protein